MEPCSHRKKDPLITLTRVTLRRGDRMLLPGTSREIKSGENWAILGPNGSGKSTLLSLITGDNLQVYANEVYLFGKKRGEGESIWTIRQGIGEGTETGLIYVTHHEEEMIPCIHHILRLEKPPRAVTSVDPVPENLGPEGFSGDPQREDG